MKDWQQTNVYYCCVCSENICCQPYLNLEIWPGLDLAIRTYIRHLDHDLNKIVQEMNVRDRTSKRDVFSDGDSPFSFRDQTIFKLIWKCMRIHKTLVRASRLLYSIFGIDHFWNTQLKQRISSESKE